MTGDGNSSISRRRFVQGSGAVATGLIVGSRTARSEPVQESPTAPVVSSPLPTRVLGRTNVPVTTMTLGTAPCGFAAEIPPPDIAKIVNYAIDLGISSIDTAPAYEQAEEGVGLALGSRRKDVFLATKVLAKNVQEAEKSLSNSFRLLKTDWIDLVYHHNVGECDAEKEMQDDGVFTWLLNQKKAGKFKFLGISGHNHPDRFIPFLETGLVDVLLTLVNFVDRHTYGFEEKVLPIARKHNVGIVAMKVFGGARKKEGSYKNPKCPPELDVCHLSQAVRYALGTPGVATVNLGVHNKEQVLKNLEMVRNFKPLQSDEESQLAKLGKTLSEKWGPHFGPVV